MVWSLITWSPQVLLESVVTVTHLRAELLLNTEKAGFWHVLGLPKDQLKQGCV